MANIHTRTRSHDAAKYPQVTNVCETHQSWERGLKLFNPVVSYANVVGM
jgi:hypothetical protein